MKASIRDPGRSQDPDSTVTADVDKLWRSLVVVLSSFMRSDA